jgi:uncharacterized OB-fold protein
MSFHESSRGLTPKQPTLYRLGDSGDIELLGARCEVCSNVTVASAHHGCGHCSAPPEQLHEIALSGHGKLRSFVTVHQALVPGRPAPYVFASIALAEGPVVGAIVNAPSEEGLAVGADVRATAIPIRAEGSLSSFECQFTPEVAQ